jgi:hypothetical protein
MELAELTHVVEGLRVRVQRLEAPRQPKLVPQQSVVVQQAKIESWISGYGFARLGIISLVTGVAFLVADSYAWLGAPLKILLGYTIAAAFIAAGRTFLKKPLALAQILVAGGLGVAYYTTYAMHYVPSARLIASPIVGLLLLAAMVLVIIIVAHRMQSETVAGVALFLGLHTGMVSPITSFTLLSSVLLAGGAAFFLAKNRWVYVPVSTLLAVYATHLLWILGNPMISNGSSHDLGHFSTSVLFASLYFVTFSIALLLAASDLKRATTTLFATLNWAALGAIVCFEYHTHESSGLAAALGILAGCHVLLALVCARLRQGRAAAEILLVLATLTLSLAAWIAASGATQVVLAWSMTSLVTLSLAYKLRMGMLGIVSSSILLLAYLAQVPAMDDLQLAALLALVTMVHHRVACLMRKSEAVPVPLSYAHAAALTWLALGSVSASVAANHVVLLWLVCALALFLLGLALREFSYRMAGIAVFVLSFARLFLIDMAALAPGYRIAAFIALGVILLAISFASSRRSQPSAQPAAQHPGS